MSQASDQKFTSRFAEIPKPRCLEPLAQKKSGRSRVERPRWSEDPACDLPVLERHGRLPHRPRMGRWPRSRTRTRVAFEIDEIDESGKPGSVMVGGAASRGHSGHTLSTLWRKGPVPWAGGVRNVFIAITPESVAGRAVQSDSGHD